jgi:ABC-2 type transport system permease protein
VTSPPPVPSTVATTVHAHHPRAHGAATLLRAELRRLCRNRRAFVFTAALPGLFFLMFAAADSPERLDGLAVAPYLMVSMATYGAMNALLSGAGVIAAERAAGWTRQLRVAGLPGVDYVIAKVAVAYLGAALGLGLVLVLGATAKDVHLSATTWAAVAASVLVGLLPVAALGIVVGYAARPQSLPPVLGIGSALLALSGGLWAPADEFPAVLAALSKSLPVFWAAAAGRDALVGRWVGWGGLAVLVAWTVALGATATWAYRRDAQRPAAAGTT